VLRRVLVINGGGAFGGAPPTPIAPCLPPMVKVDKAELVVDDDEDDEEELPFLRP
jgi:hypothetical protein